LKHFDPFHYSDLALERLGLAESGVFRFIFEAATAFIVAFFLYLLAGFLLGTSMPVVVVVSGSMEPILHRGDVVVLQGVAPMDLSGQSFAYSSPLEGKSLSELGSPLSYVNEEGVASTYGVKLQGQPISFDRNGDTVVYFSAFSGEPIIHRVMLKLNGSDGVFLLTQGDANPTFDQDCGRVAQKPPLVACGPDFNYLVIRGDSALCVQKACITPFVVDAKKVAGRQVLKIPLIGYVKLLLLDDVLEVLAGCPSRSQVGEYCGYLNAVGARH
jgi:signal peptidase